MNRIFLTFAIPTYNRAVSLKKLLDNILPQISELEENIEICISDNDSTDNTQEIVMNFKEKHPNLISYNKNEKNLGGERNVFLAMKMAKGEFIWLFGDDDLIVDNGIREVIAFIRNNFGKNIALFSLREEAYFFDEKTGKKIIYHSSFEQDKPCTYEISRENVLKQNFPCSTFISALIFNGNLFRILLEQEHAIIEKAIGLEYIHVFLYQLIFMKFTGAKAITLNKTIISQEMAFYKIYIEGRFKAHYIAKKKINRLLLSSKYADKATADIFLQDEKKLRKDNVQDIVMAKTFGSFNYVSFTGVFKLFFQNSTFVDALIFSFVFFVMFLTPSIFLKKLLKIYFFIKYGQEWKRHWLFCDAVHFKASQGQTPVQ